MAYRIRVILDAEEDVIRDLLVDENDNLNALHIAIAEAFGFNGQEMAAFYKSDNNWDQGEEIPLLNMSENAAAKTMQNTIIKHLLTASENKFIYVYDFFKMWTFYVEFIEEIKTQANQLPIIVYELGKTPKQAPQKEFKADSLFEDEFNDELNESDIFDEFDY
ncbi:MAG: IS1096 element passenger TnpR family protein [Lutibacter sp.]